MKRSTPLCAALALCLALPSVAAERLFVNAALATGSNDGSSWANAFQGALGLQAALAVADANQDTEVWVAQWTYFPGATPDEHFAMANRLAILGGFAGGETQLAERDIDAHPVVLDGDLLGDDAPATMGFPGWINVQDNALHVVRASGLDATARLDGVTVRRGNQTWAPVAGLRGANVWMQNSACQLIDVTILEGFSDGGGGVAIQGGQPHFQGVRFVGNVGTNTGGAVWVADDAVATFEDCTWTANQGSNGVGLFVGNTTLLQPPNATRAEVVNSRFEHGRGPFGGPSGIGIYVSNASLAVQGCSFVDNRSVGGGGGVFSANSEVWIQGCDFVGNSGEADGGGALYALTASPSGLPMQAYDCRFIGNNGVALASQNASIVIGNSTLVANDISEFPPFGWPILTASQNASITLNNSIVRDHNINGTGQFADQWVAFLGSLTLNESCVEGWDGSLPGTGNFDADPLFVDALGLDGLRGTEDDAVRLQASSPCLDRANPSLRPSSLGSGSALGLTSAQALLVDLDGTDRHVDQPLSADFPGACPPAGDLGAYERGAFGPWTNFTPGPGTFNPLFGACQPHLAANGALTPGSLTTFDASSAPPSSPGWIVFGLTQANLLVEGQLLVPNLNQFLPMNSDPLGHAHKQLPFPTTLPSGLTIYAQTWFFDLTTFQWKATNAQVGQTP